MASLARDNEHIHYTVTGNGPPLILGHSLLCGGWMWEPLLPELSKKFTVINVEFRGHGASSASRPFTLHDLADDWLALLDHLGHRQAIMVGLSMGAMTAMRLALRAPDRIAALVLIDSSADAEGLRKKLEYRALTLLYRRFGMNDLLAARVMPLMLGTTTRRTRPELEAAVVERIRQHDRPALLHAINAVVGRDDISERLRMVALPTLILCGDEDRATPVKRSQRIHERMRGSELVTLPASGHLSALEQPARVGAEITTFLTRVT